MSPSTASYGPIGRLGRWTASHFKLVVLAWAVVAIGLARTPPGRARSRTGLILIGAAGLGLMGSAAFVNSVPLATLLTYGDAEPTATPTSLTLRRGCPPTPKNRSPVPVTES